MKTEFDYIVIGAGPGGATAAALVAEQGFSTLLLERRSFPVFMWANRSCQKRIGRSSV